MAKDWIWIGLLALAGFLVGGAYVMWKSMKVFAGLLAVAAVLAGVGAVLWMM
ncbi:hypothetical protein LX15_000695 [Streptoalloteichus tenebrarius]|uniref:Uncharacterized protein n=1 Tax=Streptoalloteichus tenebrarius (strain ATCC 17920 / DSM 40477 / JCM 4838 / CBS 697.72 / NBRC 16177 / NCIMB 11028 / NRRL B-12390 / A12253. 1 / ISP 5477) TaxID=1933 RepID=A0ABT1HNB8_STRSD|nr:hypothetical protein [Streptoalloteichus tenebrarius]MCP2257012.1 hypothetical protein [Streptoalloteichus tenebrarius]BFF00076.1 hypothetical protein GCM10020241_17510 [Streptoalloteichus tenebrarius]